MPMREECKHFQSRTYADGETARFCVLDLAPEAPWRCPDNCPRYERRLADVAWQHGTLIDPATPAEPEMTADVSTLLDEAENIVNVAGPAIVAEEEEARERAAGGSWWNRVRSSFRRPR
jgi:hypothetical protein